MKQIFSIKQTFFVKSIFVIALLSAMLFAASAANRAPRAFAALQANLGINGFFATNKAPRGRAVQAAVVVEIPEGYHVNANRPLGKYAVPTVLKIEAPEGFRVSPVAYPSPIVRRFSFSNDQLAVYEGRAVMRFNVTVPANYSANDAELRVRLRYQSCNDEACFPPTTRDITMPVQIAAANESLKRINVALFAGSGVRRK